jgi:hypothetical protein
MFRKLVRLAITSLPLTAFAEAPPADAPPIVWPKSNVTIIFAPDHGRTSGKSGAAARIGGPASGIEFSASGGMIGLRLPEEFATAAAMTIGSDGRRTLHCGRGRDVIEKMRSDAQHSTGRRLRDDK